MSTSLDHNRTVFDEHRDELIDPDLVAIDQELLDGHTESAVAARWAAWNATYTALQEALAVDAPHLIPRLRALTEATGDLAATNDAAGFTRGAALTSTLHPSPAHLDGISLFEAFQLVPLGVIDVAWSCRLALPFQAAPERARRSPALADTGSALVRKATYQGETNGTVEATIDPC